MLDASRESTAIQQGAGKDLEGVSDRPDALAQLEKKTVELDRTKAEVEGLRQDIHERKRYAGRIFYLICGWVSAMFLLLLAEGLGRWWWLRFFLPQPVLLATIGGTTLNVLGLFYIVAHYLFPDRGPRK